MKIHKARKILSDNELWWTDYFDLRRHENQFYGIDTHPMDDENRREILSAIERMKDFLSTGI
uniref:Uncharacterized protein n=1 Tax=viral metagenome TaxID=1070528 RepID=A0A6M3XVP2_9ZZZZ